MKYTDTMVTFNEVPDEISLCINISGCPNRCPGCHSPELWEDIGTELTKESLKDLIDKMGGVEPNLVTDVYKVREGSWTQTRIWSKINLGTLKKTDLFITDSKMYPVEDFSIHSEYNMVNWDEETDKGYIEKIKKLNEELI